MNSLTYPLWIYSRIRGLLKKLNFIHTDHLIHVESVCLMSKARSVETC